MQRLRKIVVIGICLMGMNLLSGCATRPTDPDELAIYEQNNDPLEPMNRAIFGFNQVASDYVLDPAVRGYRKVVPEPVRDGVDNFLTNLKQPIYLVNALLQGDLSGAGSIAGRFTVNTLVGFFGVFDTASEAGIPVVQRDFGQTLAVWGVTKSGPYLVLPILGPSTLRETIGIGVDSLADPVDWALYRESPWWAYGRTAASGFVRYDNTYDLLDNMKKNSTDYYATMRSMYQQNRQKVIKDLRGETVEETQPDYDFDFPDDEDE